MKTKRKVTIVLPFPLPTWNRILAMHHFQKKQLRDLIHQGVDIAVNKGSFDSWEKVKYMKLIRPTVKKLKK